MGGVTGSYKQRGRGAAGLILLFDAGARPSAAQVRAAIETHARASVSFDPRDRESRHPIVDADTPEGIGAHWLELLLDGLTFDLLGLAGDPPVAVPQITHRFGIEVDLLESPLEGVGLFAGPHLAAAAHALPVMRAQLDLAAHLATSLKGVKAVCWTPARSAIAPAFFARTTEAWLKGGPFPALGLVGYALTSTGDLLSEGLEFLIGCELIIDARLSLDPAAATRLAARAVHTLVGSEMPTTPSPFADGAGGTLLLSPSPSAGLVRIGPM